MLKTPPGVAWPFEPVLTLARPMRMPLRYTCMVCSGTLTSTTSGPLGESCGFHQYSPGLSGPVGLPVGEPFVWNDGCGIAPLAMSARNTTAEMRMVLDFISFFRFCFVEQKLMTRAP